MEPSPEQGFQLHKENFTAILSDYQNGIRIADHAKYPYTYSRDIVLENAKLWTDGTNFILEGDRLVFKHFWKRITRGVFNTPDHKVEDVRPEYVKHTKTVHHFLRADEEVETEPYIDEGWYVLKKTKPARFEIYGGRNIVLEF